MVSAQMTTLTGKLKDTIAKILDSGPDMQENLNDAKLIIDAGTRIRDRFVKRYGPGIAGTQAEISAPLTDEELQQLLEQPSVKGQIAEAHKALGLGAGDGLKGPFVDMLMQLIQLAMTNPQLLALIMSLFTKKTTTV